MHKIGPVSVTVFAALLLSVVIASCKSPNTEPQVTEREDAFMDSLAEVTGSNVLRDIDPKAYRDGAGEYRLHLFWYDCKKLKTPSYILHEEAYAIAQELYYDVLGSDSIYTSIRINFECDKEGNDGLKKFEFLVRYKRLYRAKFFSKEKLNDLRL